MLVTGLPSINGGMDSAPVGCGVTAAILTPEYISMPLLLTRYFQVNPVWVSVHDPGKAVKLRIPFKTVNRHICVIVFMPKAEAMISKGISETFSP